MATRRYSIAEGEIAINVTEAVGAATATKAIELTVDLAAGLNKKTVLLAIEQLESYITKGIWPPA